MIRPFAVFVGVSVGIALVGCQANDELPMPTEQKAEASAASDSPTVPPPFSEADERDIREQIERNWNLASLAGSSDLSGMMVETRINLLPDGTITGVQVLNSQPTPEFRQVTESAIRAVMLSSPLTLPAGQSYDYLIIRFHPADILR